MAEMKAARDAFSAVQLSWLCERTRKKLLGAFLSGQKMGCSVLQLPGMKFLPTRTEPEEELP